MRKITVRSRSLLKAVPPILAARIEPLFALHGIEFSQLVLLVRRIPRLGEFVFERRGGMWYAEKNGFVKAFHIRNAGLPLSGQMTVGSQIRVRGRGTVRLKYSLQLHDHVVSETGLAEPCLEVAVTTGSTLFQRPRVEWGKIRRNTRFEALVTLKLAALGCAVAGGRLARVTIDGKPAYMPSMKATD